MNAARKLAAARTRLILDKPFLGALALRLTLIESDDDWRRTTWSDGESLYYNRRYIDRLDVDEAQFVVSREALHCALLHFHRRGNRERERWQAACDLALNALLIEDGLKAPAGVDLVPEYAGLVAEEIYPLLPVSAENRASCDHDNQRGSTPADNAPLSPERQELLAARWRQRLAAAEQQARQAGKLGAGMARLVERRLQPKLPWRSLLAQYLGYSARTDYSYARPSTRRGDPAVFPGLRGEEIELVVAIDTSGSIRATEIDEFCAEIDAIKGLVRARIALLYCDAQLAADCPRYFEPWDEFRRDPSIEGGGGTDFRPVFEWIERQDRRPDTLVYFTDAQGEFPARMPDYAVLWLVKGAAEVPFGARIALND